MDRKCMNCEWNVMLFMSREDSVTVWSMRDGSCRGRVGVWLVRVWSVRFIMHFSLLKEPFLANVILLCFFRFLIVYFLSVFRLFSSPPFNNGSMNEFRLSLDSSSFHLNTLLSHLLNNTFLYSVFFGNLDFNRSFNSESGNLLFMFTLLIAVSVVQTDR